MAALVTKLSKLKAYMAAGDHYEAIRLANSFGHLGTHKEAITRAWGALQNPAFYRSIDKDPDELVALGVAAIKERYNIGMEPNEEGIQTPHKEECSPGPRNANPGGRTMPPVRGKE